ncbi:MAG: 1,4-alpha-glucan branching protein GlgB [Ruminococcaceae bacterium]|nr:1,4-alpha-glucan branching protein GlgB [Oscillospiraceae bacterium]
MVTTKNTNLSEKDTSLPAYLFHQGTNYIAYEYLGAHGEKTETGYRYTFRVWAPNAKSISLLADFTNWDYGWQMHRVTDGGVWEVAVEAEGSLAGKYYKFAVTGQNGETHYKSDPYAFHAETLGKTASIVADLDGHTWRDGDWMKKRMSTVCPKTRGFKPKVHHFYSAPLNIYEVHLGSWRTRDGRSNADGEHYLNYREIADKLSAYVLDMGYTHVELLPIMEHPFDGSWGYQVTGYYAPTSRFGTPDDFKYFVDKMHSCGIGVILDWVPAHFPKDENGLFEFDGQPLYEYQGWDRMESPSWGTRYFDVGRPEVQSFLVSNALFWMREYHVDGLRIDAVAAMLYLDFDREPGKWLPNSEGTNHNLEAIAFFKKLNEAVFGEFPDMLMIAEESTAWPMITKPVFAGGLGFNFKWNMGWANDIFEYVSTDSIARKYHHNKLTFPLMYAFSENYILPISHDEVVHCKKSLVDKCFGEYDDKFACMRTLIMYMMTLPGKKLTFMGTEFAQFREWDYTNQLEWFMIDYPRHVEMQRFVRAINHLYLENSELWDIDDGWDGFTWIDPDAADINVISYRRRDKKGKELIVVLNFAPVERRDFVVEVPKMGRYEEVLSTDNYEYGGKNKLNEEGVRTRAVTDERGERHNYITINLPPLGGVIFRKQQNS